MGATGPPQAQTPVLRDVAKAAGVSHQTVSRVLNDHPNVSTRTRAVVEKAIVDLGYRRNAAARSLVTKRSQTIGVLGSELSEYGPSNTLLGVEHAARSAGYFVSIAALREVTPEAIQYAVVRFLDQGVDGVVVVVPHPGTLEVLQGFRADTPLVAVGFSGDERLTGVAVDQRQGARLAVDHLVGLGHRSVAHLSGPAGWLDAAARIEGWRESLTAAGLPAAALLTGDWSAECGYRTGRQLAGHLPFTACFVANDQMALGMLLAFHEAGIAVPGDVSVVGYDDQPESAFLIPPLTTVRQDFEELGRSCIQVLLDEVFHRAGTGAVVEPRLVVRATTAALRP